MIVSRIQYQEIFDNVPGAYTEVTEPAKSPTGWDEAGMPLFQPKVLKVLNFKGTATSKGVLIECEDGELMEKIRSYIEAGE